MHAAKPLDRCFATSIASDSEQNKMWFKNEQSADSLNMRTGVLSSFPLPLLRSATELGNRAEFMTWPSAPRDTRQPVLALAQEHRIPFLPSRLLREGRGVVRNHQLLWISDPVRPRFSAITSYDFVKYKSNFRTACFSPGADFCQYSLLTKNRNLEHLSLTRNVKIWSVNSFL